MQTNLAKPPKRQQKPRSEDAAAAQTDTPKARPAQASAPEAGSPATPLPFDALEHLFVFTTGDKQSVWESSTANQKFKEWVGQELEVVRQGVPRDVVFNCDPVGLLGSDGNLSKSVWKLIAGRRPELVQKQREGGCCLSVRTFRLESDAVVALALFYNAQKIEPEQE
jgi:hypothetical protein